MKYIRQLCLCGSLMLLSACGEETQPVTYAPVVTTGAASNIYREGATLGGSIRNAANATVEEFGILLSEYKDMAVCTEWEAGPFASADAYTISIRNLTAGKTYYYCAYAGSGYSTSRGEVKSFDTPQSNAPVLGTLQCDASNERSFKVSVAVEDVGDHELLLTGICWRMDDGTGKEPTIADATLYVESGSDARSFEASVTGLVPNSSYLVRAFAGNAQGVGYSEPILIRTNDTAKPVLSDISVVSSTPTSVTVKASVLNRSDLTLTRIGFCWTSEGNAPTMDGGNLHQDLPEQLDAEEFTCTISGLRTGTAYVIRAYAVSEDAEAGREEGYSEGVTFTPEEATVPDVNPGGGIDDLPTEDL